jgi:DNA-binding XRE family transcriptional regulator
MENKESFKNRFEQIRAETGLSNVVIAKRIGISRQSLNKIKTVGNPRTSTIRKIAEAMNVHPSVFFL